MMDWNHDDIDGSRQATPTAPKEHALHFSVLWGYRWREYRRLLIGSLVSVGETPPPIHTTSRNRWAGEADAGIQDSVEEEEEALCALDAVAGTVLRGP